MPKVTAEIEIPDGYEFVRVGWPKKGELFETPEGVTAASPQERGF